MIKKLKLSIFVCTGLCDQKKKQNRENQRRIGPFCLSWTDISNARAMNVEDIIFFLYSKLMNNIIISLVDGQQKTAVELLDIAGGLVQHAILGEY